MATDRTIPGKNEHETYQWEEARNNNGFNCEIELSQFKIFNAQVQPRNNGFLLYIPVSDENGPDRDRARHNRKLFMDPRDAKLMLKELGVTYTHDYLEIEDGGVFYTTTACRSGFGLVAGVKANINNLGQFIQTVSYDSGWKITPKPSREI